MNKVLIVAPHPDDETLGCGGTILKHKKNGDQIFWLIITGALVEEGFNEDRVASRQEEIEKVAESYGFDKVVQLNIPTAKLDRYLMSELIGKIAKVVTDLKPTTIYLPNQSDVHTDHQIIFKATYSCTKNFRYPFIKEILMYETLSETEFAPAVISNVFIPNVFVNIEEYFDKKVQIFKIFESEVMDDPFPRSVGAVEALARYRGSSIGKKYAEAFTLLKRIS
jgi:LmbE family N-acetylglucosaminyl deacetylase